MYFLQYFLKKSLKSFLKSIHILMQDKEFFLEDKYKRNCLELQYFKRANHTKFILILK